MAHAERGLTPMRRLMTAGLLVLLLAGCNGATLTKATPAQRLYAADGGYRAMLELAVAYKEACLARPRGQRARCLPIIEKIRVIDRSYNRLRSGFDRATASESDLRGIETVIGELKLALASAHAEEAGR